MTFESPHDERRALPLEPGSLAVLHDPSIPVDVSITQDGTISVRPHDGREANASSPALPPESLGRSTFRAAHNLRYAYAAGAMAGGISGSRMVVAMTRAGMLSCLGTGAVDPKTTLESIAEVQRQVDRQSPFEVNLLFNPLLPAEEMEAVEGWMEMGVQRLCASGYAMVTLPLVYFRTKGITLDAEGTIRPRHFVSAKVSRLEVAKEFLQPANEKHLSELLQRGLITEQEAALARRIPVAEDITAEADSGGHTDRQPLLVLLSAFQDLRSEIEREYKYTRPIHIGAAGGISTPVSFAAALLAGADYVMTGSINQSCVEADTSSLVKRMLCDADVAAVDMAPAGDLFEMGTQVQVLRHGTMYAARARKLFELYRQHESWDDISERDRAHIEKVYFRKSVESVWEDVRSFFAARDARQIERAAANPRHRMALIFRWYLGLSSRWARDGIADRKSDFQVWCGPSMGAFNRWVRGSFLEQPERREVAVVGRNLCRGAAIVLRTRMLAWQGIPFGPDAWRIEPLP